MRWGFVQNKTAGRWLAYILIVFTISTAFKFEVPAEKAEAVVDPEVAIAKRNMPLLDQMIKKYFKTVDQDDMVCFIEGKGGISYGYALTLRYMNVPLHFSRILTYPSTTEKEKGWHDYKFQFEMRPCSHAFLLGLNSVIENNYAKFFNGPMVEGGFYEIIKDEKTISMNFIDCMDCDR